MQDMFAFAFAVAAAGALLVLGLSPVFPRLRPLMGGRRRPNLVLWAGLAAAMTLATALTVPHP